MCCKSEQLRVFHLRFSVFLLVLKKVQTCSTYLKLHPVFLKTSRTSLTFDCTCFKLHIKLHGYSCYSFEVKNEQFSYLGWKTQKWFVTFCQCLSTRPVLTISLPRWRGRGWLRDRSPGLLWSVSAGRGDHPVRHLSSSVPPRLPWAWAGQGPRGQVELSPLCKYICSCFLFSRLLCIVFIPQLISELCAYLSSKNTCYC